MSYIDNLPKSRLKQSESEDITQIAFSNLPESRIEQDSNWINSAYGSIMTIHPGDISQYEKYMPSGGVPMWQNPAALNEARARNQKWINLVGNSIAQAIGASTIGGAIENVGNWLQWRQVNKVLGDTEYEFSQNFLQTVGHSIQEYVREQFPIHQTARAQVGGPGAIFTKTYTTSHFPSVFTSLALMGPAFLAGKATMGLSTLIGRATLGTARWMGRAKTFHTPLKLTSRATNVGRAMSYGKGYNRWAKSITTGLHSRHMYSYTESADNYRMVFEEMIERGFTEEEAHKYANTAARRNYLLGYLNLWKDVWAWRLMYKYGHYANRYLGARDAAALHKTKYKGIPLVGEQGVRNLDKLAQQAKVTKGLIARDLFTHGLLEGFEEYNIQWQKAEGRRKAYIEAGIEEPDEYGTRVENFAKRIYNHTLDPHTFDSFFWGFMGGLTFGVFGKAAMVKAEGAQIKSAERAVERTLDHIKEISRIHKIKAELANDGFVENAAILDLQLENYLISEGLQSGTIAIDIEMLRELSQHTNEQLEQAGFTPNTQQDFKALADSMEAAALEYNKRASINRGYGEFDSVIAERETVLRHHRNRLKGLKEQYKKEFSELSTIEDSMPEFMTTEAKAKFELLRALKAGQRSIAAREQIINEHQKKVDNLKQLIDDDSVTKKQALHVAMTRLQNEIDSHNHIIQQIRENKPKIEEQIQSIDKVLKETRDKETVSQINDFISNNTDITSNELQRAINNIDQHLDKVNEDIEYLSKDENVKKEYDKYNKLVDQYQKLKKEEFELKANEATTIAALDRLHNEYGKEYTDIYNQRKKQLKQQEELDKKNKEFKSKVNDIATKKFREQVGIEGDNVLSAEEVEFYDLNKEAIDTRVQELVDKHEQTPAEPVDDSTYLEKLVSELDLAKNVIEQILDANTYIGEDGIIRFDSSIANKANAILSMVTYIRNIGRNLKTHRALAEKLVNNHESFIRELFGKEFIEGLDVATKGDPNTMSEAHIKAAEKVIGDTEIASDILSKLNSVMNGVKRKLNADKPPTKNESKASIISKKIDAITDRLNDIDITTDKESRDLNSELSDKLELIKELADVLYEYYEDVTTKTTVGLADVFNIYIAADRTDALINNYQKLKLLFDVGAILNPEPILLNKANENVYIDFKNVPKNINRDNFIIDYIDTQTQVAAEYTPSDGVYLYLHDILQLTDPQKLTSNELDLLNTFLKLKPGDKLNVVVDPTHVEKDTRYKTAEEKEAIASDPDMVPIAIMVGDNRVGFVQTLEQVHLGIPYRDPNTGKFNPFSNIVNDKDVNVVLDNIESLRSLYETAVDAVDNRNGSKAINLSKLNEETLAFIEKIAYHNRDKGVEITNNNIINLLSPLFYDINKNHAFTAPFIKIRFANHYRRFLNDYSQTLAIRSHLSAGKKIEMEVKKKSISPKFNNWNKAKPIKNNITETEIDGDSRIQIAYTDLQKHGVSTNQLYLAHNGQPINIANEIKSTYSPFVIIETAPGQHSAFTLNRANLKNKEGKKIANWILDTLTELADEKNDSPANKAFRDTIELYVQSAYKDGTSSLDTFQSKVNTWNSITFARYGEYYELRYNSKKGTFEYVKGSTLIYTPPDGSASYESSLGVIPNRKNKDWVAIDRNKAMELLSTLKRSIKLDIQNNRFPEGPFTDVVNNIEYESYEQYVIESDALLTNLEAVRDTDGSVLTNLVPASKIGKPHTTLHATYKVVDGTGKPIEHSNAQLTQEVSNLVNRTLTEVFKEAEFAEFSILAELLEKVGLKGRIGPEVIPGATPNSQASTTEITADGEFVINLHPRIVAINKKKLVDGKVQTVTELVDKFQRARILSHEALHPLLEHGERNMTDSQREAYIAELKEFRESIQEAISTDKTLTANEKRILEVWLKVASQPNNHSETITYAFFNSGVTEILAKLDGNKSTSKGFWNKLFNIIASIFDIKDGTKLSELANILDGVINLSIETAQETKVETEQQATPEPTPTVSADPTIQSDSELITNMTNAQVIAPIGEKGKGVQSKPKQTAPGEVFVVLSKDNKTGIVIPSKDANDVGYMLNYSNVFFKNLFQIENMMFSSPKGITLKKPARVVNKDGKWVVESEGLIRFTSEPGLKIELAPPISKPPWESIDLFGEIVYNKYASEVQARYNMTQAEFVRNWNELTISERLQEIKCL